MSWNTESVTSIEVAVLESTAKSNPSNTLLSMTRAVETRMPSPDCEAWVPRRVMPLMVSVPVPRA